MAARRRVASGAALALAAAAFVAPATATASHVMPEEWVAQVGEIPVLKADFDHWFEVAAVTHEPLDEPERVAVTRQVTQLLVSFLWLEGEAADRGIRVSRKAVLRSYARTKRSSFPEQADFDKFLADSRQTTADIKLRVRMDLLSNRLRDRAVRGARSPRVQLRRIERFVRRYRRKWRARTVCGEQYAHSDCGSTLPVAAPIE